MQLDTRLARLLHVLIHMRLRGGTTTSDTIAQMLHTNPSLVRRTMAALREAGYVDSVAGPGGGWVLRCDLAEVTVRDIYEAIAHKRVFALGLADDNPACPVESAVNGSLQHAFERAQDELLRAFQAMRLDEIAAQAIGAAR